MARILVIDDDATARELISDQLKAEGFSVATAAGGLEGLKLAKELRPIAITLDVMMPGMDGLTTLGQLRANARTASIPVIFMTAKVQKAEVDQYRAAGAGFIAKPFDPMRLPADVARLLDTDLRRTA